MGISNHSKRNILHLAALHASTEMLDMLTAANLSGLEAEARDKDGHSPNECFLNCRSAHCAVSRSSADLERQTWVRLMKSARRQAGLSLYTAAAADDDDDDEEETGQRSEDVHGKHSRSNSLSSVETSNDSVSEEEYADAYDGIENED